MELPKVVQKSPFVIELAAGRYSWCSCGLSRKQPFCDGSHKGTDMRSVKVEITEKKKVALCGCKKTGNPPYCDGSHKNL